MKRPIHTPIYTPIYTLIKKYFIKIFKIDIFRCLNKYIFNSSFLINFY